MLHIKSIVCQGKQCRGNLIDANIGALGTEQNRD
jgi:hypothetical protein